MEDSGRRIGIAVLIIITLVYLSLCYIFWQSGYELYLPPSRARTPDETTWIWIILVSFIVDAVLSVTLVLVLANASGKARKPRKPISIILGDIANFFKKIPGTIAGFFKKPSGKQSKKPRIKQPKKPIEELSERPKKRVSAIDKFLVEYRAERDRRATSSELPEMVKIIDSQQNQFVEDELVRAYFKSRVPANYLTMGFIFSMIALICGTLVLFPHASGSEAGIRNVFFRMGESSSRIEINDAILIFTAIGGVISSIIAYLRVIISKNSGLLLLLLHQDQIRLSLIIASKLYEDSELNPEDKYRVLLEKVVVEMDKPFILNTNDKPFFEKK